MSKKNEKILVGILLFFSVAIFFAFGFFHLAKFETTDEHLWKYERIGQYWKALGDQDWEKTYINDKPGVTVALFSGTGLFFEPDPQRGVSSAYERGEFVNFVFRFPILLLATLSLYLFFWLALKAFDSHWTALFATMFLSINPILIGISQIINPDSFLWIFGSLAVVAYLAFLNKKEKKLLVLVGLFSGFAMLSKYTSIALFLFYFLVLISKIIFSEDEERKANQTRFWKEVLNLGLIFVISLSVFSVFLPAVFANPDYLTKGVMQFVKRGNFSSLIVPGMAILAFALYFRKKAINVLFDFFTKHRKKFLVFVCFLFLLMSLVLLINVWTGQKIIPFDDLRDVAYTNEPKKFNFKPLLSEDSVLEKNSKLFFLEAYPFVFSLTPMIFFLIMFVLGKAIFGKIKNSSSVIIFSVVSFSFAYLLMTLMVKVVANVRYSITLQFLFAILATVGLVELLETLKKTKKKHFLIASLTVLLCGSWSLWFARPFYFNYESPLLPKKFTINSSWGHGFYEAAQYLNSKPDAEKMLIWSNSSTICPFFKGKCISSRKIDLAVQKPDYFVLSKRGVIKERSRFIFLNSQGLEKDSEYYFDNLETNYEWSLFINDRKENYVKIIKFEN